MSVEKIVQYISEQVRKERALGLAQPMVEDTTHAMDYDEEDPKGEKALSDAHKHFKKQGYTISHEGSDDPKHKEHKNPDVTYHYGMGDDQHHAFTIHKKGKAANDPHIKKFTKHLSQED